jgi:hypothetical protein
MLAELYAQADDMQSYHVPPVSFLKYARAPNLEYIHASSHQGEQSRLNNSLQLPGIAQRIFDRYLANRLLIALLINRRLDLVREVYPPVLDSPPSALRKRDDGALAVQEE